MTLGTTWKHAAERMIAREALARYLDANTLPGGRRRSKHRPYTLPEWVYSLVDAMGRDDETEGKRIMLCVRDGAYSLV